MFCSFQYHWDDTYLRRYLKSFVLGGKADRQAAIRYQPLSTDLRVWLFQH